MTATAPVSHVWEFASSSGRLSYQTLQYADGSLSCNCPGWTRRVAFDGSRSCKHTRCVELGSADKNATSHAATGVKVQRAVTTCPSAASTFGRINRKVSE